MNEVNNEPITDGELRRTLAYLGAQLKRHEEILNAMQTKTDKLVEAVERLARIVEGHQLILAAATRPASKPAGELN